MTNLEYGRYGFLEGVDFTPRFEKLKEFIKENLKVEANIDTTGIEDKIREIKVAVTDSKDELKNDMEKLADDKTEEIKDKIDEAKKEILDKNQDNEICLCDVAKKSDIVAAKNEIIATSKKFATTITDKISETSKEISNRFDLADLKFEDLNQQVKEINGKIK